MARKIPLDILDHSSAEEVECLIAGESRDPHRILGAHPAGGAASTTVVIRAFHPDASDAEVCLEGAKGLTMTRIHAGGLFAAAVKRRRWPFSYKIRFSFPDGSTWERKDPYAFLPTLGEIDLYLHGEGTHERLYERLGAHLRMLDGHSGVTFAVWAPNARRVSVVGDFNRWDGRLYPMRMMGASGIWELFVPDLEPGSLYKFEIKAPEGALRLKTDPYAFAMQTPPNSGSIIWATKKYLWNDSEWMKERPFRDPRRSPMAIYEAHLGSWMRREDEGGSYLTYRELAERLVKHVKDFGFTHIELMPVAEHPFDGSWGYQVTGYFAPTSRYGTPDDFKFFVDICHQNGVGVILDWVPAHFPKDDYSLRWFDGTALYEHLDPRQGEQREWGTLIFNFGRNEVRNFLLASALFWLDEYHIDGLRVDAVASMLYLDYSKKPHEWIPNRYGGKENLEAIEFLRRMNEAVYGQFPGCFTIAEESTTWQGVTLPTYLGGLGFGFKWNMGWMHDTLHYFNKDSIHRSYHHNRLTFSMIYAYSENFVLPLSHDEVVYGKKSLLNKMPGDMWQKFANLKLLIAYMYTHPGKKLLFMGTELAPEREWNHDCGLDWGLAKDAVRQGLQLLMKDMGKLYLENSALWEWDHDPRGFSWIDCQDWQQSAVSYIRSSSQEYLVCILNLTPIIRRNYRIGAPAVSFYRERLNTDSELYGGSNVGNSGLIITEPIPFHGFPQSLSLTLPP
ncbi:MAG: 1,4-alpha-glucan branching protein GlgB, partial [Candidatus Lindowbacteria bacterium]|nr:1,4-alpha-glucan branching protein GlgB [Candidatus Lindowbacteria bacterium]